MSNRSWTILRFAVAIGIILFLLSKISIAGVFDSILSLKIHFVVPAIPLSLAAWYLAAYRLKFFSNMQGLEISTFRAYEITLSALFYGLFMPGGNLTTGLIKFYKLSWKDKKLSEGFISIAIDRVFATAAVCLVGIFFWLISIPDDSGEFLVSMIIVIFCLLVFSYILFLDKDQKVIKWLIKLINKVYFSAKLNNFTKSLSGLGEIPVQSHIFIGAVSIAIHLVNTAGFYLLLKSLNIVLPFASIGWIRSVVVLITIIPITISGLGLREASLIILLGTFGVSDSSAFAYSLLVFTVTRIVPGLLGGLFEAKALIVSGRTS